MVAAAYQPAFPMVAAAVEKRQKVVVVVDPYSSGRYLVQELQQQQWPMIAVQSSQDLAAFWLAQHDESLFVKTVRHESFELTVAALVDYDVAGVMPGSEPGVIVAEQLQDHFKLPGNGAATTEWRRDKHAMQERLREVGVRAVKQIYSSDVEEILAWQANWGRWPIIVKPAMSGGTDGVHWCHCAEDVQAAHAAECGKLNVNGVVNNKLLAQEYLDGLEYIVDCVSHDGRHVLSGIWVYKKTKNPSTRSISYEYARLLESTGTVQDVLIEYVFKALDALGLRYGPSHSEAIITEDGPCLVETGARMHGLKGPKMTEYGTGIGTHELVVDVALNEARMFNDLFAKSSRYTVKKWAFETMLRNDNLEGILAKDIDVPAIRNLASVFDVYASVHKGEELKLTRDLATAPGVVLQVHAKLDVVLADIQRIRELEATSLYHVTAPDRLTKSPQMFPASPFVLSPQRSRQVTACDEEERGGDVTFEIDILDLDAPDDIQ